MQYVVKYCRYFASPRWSLHFDYYNLYAVNCEHSTVRFSSHSMLQGIFKAFHDGLIGMISCYAYEIALKFGLNSYIPKLFSGAPMTQSADEQRSPCWR